jgi:predicted molibdopterin-dependent oxidoreductase YjgC
MFRRLHEPSEAVTITVDGTPLRAASGDTVAAALMASANPISRETPVTGAPRAPFCLMGVCFDCLMEIDGVPNRQACMVEVRAGMTVRRQPRPAPVSP